MEVCHSQVHIVRIKGCVRENTTIGTFGWEKERKKEGCNKKDLLFLIIMFHENLQN